MMDDRPFKKRKRTYQIAYAQADIAFVDGNTSRVTIFNGFNEDSGTIINMSIDITLSQIIGTGFVDIGWALVFVPRGHIGNALNLTVPGNIYEPVDHILIAGFETLLNNEKSTTKTFRESNMSQKIQPFDDILLIVRAGNTDSCRAFALIKYTLAR